MGARGPKPGFRNVVKEGAETPLSFAAEVASPAAMEPAERARPSAADLENPEKLTGQALRDLAHRRGLARSALVDMPDAKVRMELLYITNRQYREEEESV